MTVGLLSNKSGSVLRLVSANGAGPTSTQSAAVHSATTTKATCRIYFSVGSGDVSKFVLSFFSFFLSAGVGVTACNGYTVNLCSLEMNGTSTPITFGGSRSLSVSAGASDTQSDPIFPVTVGLTKFAQGAAGYIRMDVTYANPSTDVQIANGFDAGVHNGNANSCFIYDVSKVSITNGVDSTGPVTYSMINGGVDGTDIVHLPFPMCPAILGTFIQNDPPVWILAGDSGCYGTGDNISSEGARGLGRMVYTNPTTPAPSGALACWNLGCNSGIASDWQNGTPSLLNNYVKYFKYGLEEYGGNGFLPSSSQAIHATWRGAGLKGIIRPSLTPRTNSTDSWATDGNQTQQSGWGPGSGADTYEQTIKGLVASDLVYVDYHTPLASLSNYWVWRTNGTAFFETSDGLHPSALGYASGKIGGTSNITTLSGTTTGTLQALVASYS